MSDRQVGDGFLTFFASKKTFYVAKITIFVAKKTISVAKKTIFVAKKTSQSFGVYQKRTEGFSPKNMLPAIMIWLRIELTPGAIEMFRIVSTVFLLISVALCVGGLTTCTECSMWPGAAEYREIAALANSSSDAAFQRFSELDVDQQLTVYLYSRNCQDDWRIESYMQADGQKKIPFVVERIKAEPKAWDKSSLVLLLISANTRCRCIAADSQIIQDLRKVGRDMRANRLATSDSTYEDIYDHGVESLAGQLRDSN